MAELGGQEQNKSEESTPRPCSVVSGQLYQYESHNPAALDCQVLADGCRVGRSAVSLLVIEHGENSSTLALNVNPESLLRSEVKSFLCFFVHLAYSPSCTTALS